MKKVFMLLIISMLAISAFGQVEPEPEKFHVTWELVLACVLGLYEIISRFVPTSKVWSIIGNILKSLTWLSDLLDRGEKTEKK